MKHSAILVLALLLAWSCDNREAGTASETQSKISADLYRPDGMPAVGARVQIFGSSDTGALPAAQVFVGSDGKIILPALAPGWYNLVARDDSGNAVFEDSLVSNGSTLGFRADTLRPTGTLVGRVKVQPQDDPRIAWIHLLGTGIYANVDDSGRFALAGVPAGPHLLEAIASRGAYTPTFVQVGARRDSVVDVGSITLIFTGLSALDGLSIVYDSIQGRVTANWNRSRAHGVAGYWVSWGDSGLGVTDTTWSQEFFAASFSNDLADTSWFDTTSLRRTIQVQAQDSSGTLGPKWASATLDIHAGYTTQRGRWTWRNPSSLPGGTFLPGSVLDTLPEGLVLMVPGANRGLQAVTRDTSTWTIWTSTDGSTWSGGWSTGKMLSSPVCWKGRIWTVTRGLDSTIASADAWPLYGRLVVGSRSATGRILTSDTISPDSGAYGALLVPHGDTLGLAPFRMGPSYYSCVSSSYAEEQGFELFVRTGDGGGWTKAGGLQAPGSGSLHESDKFRIFAGSADWTYAPDGSCGSMLMTSVFLYNGEARIRWSGPSGSVEFQNRRLRNGSSSWTFAQPLAWRDGIINPVAGGRIERWMASDPNRPWSTKPPFVPAVDWGTMTAWKGDLAVVSSDGALWLGTLDGER